MTPSKFAASLFLAAGIFAAGFTANRRPVSIASSDPVRQTPSYICPMHPSYKSDHPGDCPSCGMRLVRAEPGSAGAPGAVQVTAPTQQMIGIQTAEVRREAASHRLRTAGRVTVDEGRLYRLVAAADGWVRELGQNTTGAFVRKDQLLVSYYVRDLVATQQNFLYADQLNAQAEQQQANVAPQRASAGLNFRLALDALRSLGMTDLQIKELQKTRTAVPELRIYSPADGFVLARSISPEQRFDKGAELYRIGDISRLWVMADVFEKDREFLSPGALATVRYRGREFHARMSNALPQFDPQSRTLKTRFDVDNPGYVLRPEEFVDVEVHVEMPPAVTAPADAIVDSGRHKTVYVARANSFEPRLVTTGWRLGDRVEIIEGLQPGERVVVSGNFLIDSESRMQTAAETPKALPEAAGARDPVCGMKVDPNAPGAIQIRHGGKTYTFCSVKCRREFEGSAKRLVTEREPGGEDSGMRGPE
jgi:Cu(I)/Ag(I) efflux system membrane fusion protein